MNILDYANAARATAIYPNRGKNLAYAAFGLIEEAGELKEKVAALDVKGAVLEMGDVCWYFIASCDEAKLNAGELFALALLNPASLFDPYIQTDALVAETARIAGYVKKAIRDDGGHPSPERQKKIAASLVKVMAHIIAIADYPQYNTTIEGLFAANIQKLGERKAKNLIKGDGDYR